MEFCQMIEGLEEALSAATVGSFWRDLMAETGADRWKCVSIMLIIS